mmetsp:Transcript_380/g.461  ORF Transcript_380/g.461 Transcript_380/m.461 type:complete len:177 (-) Transcript_380:8-538(-)
MSECENSEHLIEQTECILTYAGSTKDIMINYALIAINILLVIKLFNNNTENIRRERWGIGKRWFAAFGFMFVVLFQIVLCLIVGCAGVSIIWCAICGWILREENLLLGASTTSVSTLHDTTNPGPATQQGKKIDLVSLVLFVDISVIIYYSIVEEPITTLAHFLAIIMGSCISLFG